MAAAADEPAAKMVKQEDYTKTHRSEFKKFEKNVVRENYYFPKRVIDGVEVIIKVGAILANNQLVLEVFANKECRNGLMFHKDCGRFHYELFKKSFFPAGGDIDFQEMDFRAAFNDVMAFMVKEVPKMRLYGNKLMTANAYDVITSALQEGEFFSTLPVVSRCGQCGDMNDGKLMIVEAAGQNGMENPRKRACLKCYLYDTYTDFDTDVPNYLLYYDHDKYEFDILGCRKFAERYEGGLIHEDMYHCDCDEEEEEDEDDDDDDDDEDPPVYNGPPPVIDENAEAARAA